MWWPGTELNRRRQPFQGCALPPELPGHRSAGFTSWARLGGAGNSAQRQPKTSEAAAGESFTIIATARVSLNAQQLHAADLNRSMGFS